MSGNEEERSSCQAPLIRPIINTGIASTNTIRIAETGGYETTKQFELKPDSLSAGEMWHQRTVIQPMSAEGMIATSYLSFGQVPEWKGVEIRYTRGAKWPA